MTTKSKFDVSEVRKYFNNTSELELIAPNRASVSLSKTDADDKIHIVIDESWYWDANSIEWLIAQLNEAKKYLND